MRRQNPYTNDHHTRRARAEGYPARSVYKLEEIDRRLRLISRGMRVLDLGAAPGSWTLYVAERVGPNGRVLAVDRQPILGAFPAQVELLTADALELDEAVLEPKGRFDLVLSDMAPNTSGARASDQAQSYELFLRALRVAERVSSVGSAFVGKLFMSADFAEARNQVLLRYQSLKVIRPEATRSRSSEVFLVGFSRRQPGAPDGPARPVAKPDSSGSGD